MTFPSPHNDGSPDRPASSSSIDPPANAGHPLESGSSQSLRRDRWAGWLQVAGAAGIAISILAAAVLAGFAVLAFVEGGPSAALGPGIQAIAVGIVGALGIPLLYWATRGSTKPLGPVSSLTWLLSLGLFSAGLALGGLAFNRGLLPWLLGPAAHLMASAGPVLFTASLVLRSGPVISHRRRWGHFLAGLWVAPPLALVLELFALVPTGVLVLLGLAATEGGRSALQDLAGADLNTEADLLNLLSQVLSQPIVLVVAIAFLAGLVPLIEEAVKTLTVWPLIPRRPPASQAFLGGALGGCGYALFESLLLAQPGEAWVSTMVARAGTPLIHAFATGLVSWGLIEAATYGRWLRLPALYLLAVGLHGSWNLFAAGISLAGLSVESGGEILSPAAAGILSYSGLLVLLGLSTISAAGLISIPRWLAGR